MLQLASRVPFPGIVIFALHWWVYLGGMLTKILSVKIFVLLPLLPQQIRSEAAKAYLAKHRHRDRDTDAASYKQARGHRLEACTAEARIGKA